MEQGDQNINNPLIQQDQMVLNQGDNQNYENEVLDYDEIHNINNPALEMSQLFKDQDSANKIMIGLAVIIDAALGISSLFVYLKKCSGNDPDMLEIWNYQWMYYLFAKSIYHFLISLQLFSSKRQRELCFKLGQLKTPEENIQYQYYFSTQNEKRKQQIRSNLDSQYFSFYYQRNRILKPIFYAKALVTLGMVIYGIVGYFSGSYGDLIFQSSDYPDRDCYTSLAWFSYISIILVIAGNRNIFDILIFCIIMIPIFLLVILPYLLYKRWQKRKHGRQTLNQFQTVKFAVGRLQGDTDCSICRMDYVIDEDITVLSCNNLHHFHKQCIGAWLEINSTCPICRHDFSNQLGQQNQDPIVVQNN